MKTNFPGTETSTERTPPAINYRPLDANNPDELEAVLLLNQSEVPNVGPLDIAKLTRLVATSYQTIVADVDGDIAGFVITMIPGATYESENYLWFEERYDQHLYVDRIAVSGQHRGLGIGKGLYATIAQNETARERITCEVNLAPSNPVSMAFHQKLGFELVGELSFTDKYVQRVAMLAMPISSAPVLPSA